MNADARRCSVRLIGVHRRFPTLGGMRSLARSTWRTQSSQIGQVLYHGRDGHATKPSWHVNDLAHSLYIAMNVLVRLWRFLQELAGENAYAVYCEGMRARHPERPIPTEEEFYLERLAEKYARPNRCC